MTTTADLLAHCRAAGIKLAPRGDKLRYCGPVGALTPALRQALIDNKPELLWALRTSLAGTGDPLPAKWVERARLAETQEDLASTCADAFFAFAEGHLDAPEVIRITRLCLIRQVAP